MTLGFILALCVICTICRAIIFKKHDIKPLWAFIPIANKYKLGKMIGSKRLGILNAILHPLTQLTFLFCFGYEIWIIKEYSQTIKVPVDGFSDSAIDVLVPNDVAFIAVWSKYFLIAVAAISIIVWCIMMWKLTMQQERNPWWIMIWAIIPAIAYIFFAASSTVIVNGKKYITKKIEIEDYTAKQKPEKRKKKKG